MQNNRHTPTTCNAYSLATCFCLILALCYSNSSQADIYKTTLPDGSIKYSDAPEDNHNLSSKKVDETEVTSVGFPEQQKAKQDRKKPTEQPAPKLKEIPYNQLNIDYPLDGEIFHNIGGELTVNLSITPWLKKGHKYVVRLDGSIAGGPSSRNSIAISNVYRGEHTLTAEIINQQGKRVISSKPIKIVVHQRSAIKANIEK